MENLTIAADFGASLGRAIYHDGSPEPKLILLKPEIISLSPSSILAYQNSWSLGSSYPELSAWLRVKERYYALGELARHRFRVLPHVDEPKYNKAIYQCLGIIGSVLQREKSNPSELDLSLVLPLDEFNYKQQFEEELRKALSDFTFRGVDYCLKLNKFICLPEGSGLYLRGRAAEKGQLLAHHKEITIAIVMIGYRNISLMVFDFGVIKVKETTMQGFAQMMDSIKERVPVVDEEALILAMTKPSRSKRLRAYEQMAVCEDEEMKKKEVNRLESAISEAMQEYLTVINNFLSANLKSFRLDELVIGGGTANYLKSELKKYLHSFGATKISWTENLEQRINQTFGSKIKRESLEYRLCDVYGLFYYFLKKPLPTVKKSNHETREAIKIYHQI